MKGLIHKTLDALGYEIRRKQPNAISLQRKFVTRDDPVIFDVGAHHGQTALAYRTTFPRAVIHCFEPFPDSFAALTTNIADTATCHCVALTDQTGTAMLHLNKSSSTNSILPNTSHATALWGEVTSPLGKIEVRTDTLDHFCRTLGIDHIDILKIDVQGAENRVLSGAHEMLTKRAIDLIYFEVILVPTYEGQTGYDSIATMHRLGYDLYGIYDMVVREGRTYQADLLFGQATI
jgi:FkbM family methyltransferase